MAFGLRQAKKTGVATALVVLSTLASGCMSGGGSLTNLPTDEFATVSLQIRLGRIDASAPVPGDVDILSKSGALSKSAAYQIELKDMVLRFSSNLNDTVWDTVSAGAGTGLGPSQSDDQTVNVNVSLPPLRWWNIEIRTRDLNDSLIHYGNVGPIASRGGQTVNMVVPLLLSRFSMYEARYVLPREIYPAGVPEAQRVYQKIYFHRLELVVDSVSVRDSSSFTSVTAAGTRFIEADSGLRDGAGKFFFKPNTPSDTITHVQSYAYVRTGPRVITIRAYGYLQGDSVGMEPRLLFAGSQDMTIIPGATVPPTPVVLDWKGPGSEPDTSANPPKAGEPDWSGLSMNVFIGRVGTVVQPIDVPSGIDI